VDEDKALVYLERSKSSPISLSLRRDHRLSLCDPLLEIIPRAIGRLGSLSIEATSENLHPITSQLSRPAPLLEELSICGDCQLVSRYPVLTPTLFGGDLSSLRRLCLESVRTELPWRNMVNLTSFLLAYTWPGEISVRQLLDFFESAPHLREVELHSATPTSGAQNRRLVSLACLKRMHITNGGPSFVLFDHLLIPVGAELITQADLPIGDLLPRCLDNLRNFSNFTTIQLYVGASRLDMDFSGPNGRVRMSPRTSRADMTCFVHESLAQFDTSKTERFKIGGCVPLSRDPLYLALLPMKDLRFLLLYECISPHTCIRALHPRTGSLEVVACPNLEELVLVLRSDEERFDIGSVIGMAEARASRGKKLGTVKIVDRQDEPDPEDLFELGKHVRHVEYGYPVDAIDDEED